MSGNNELIHFRITKVLSTILNKISFDTGMSKQDIIRQMIIDRISEKYDIDLLMNPNEIKNKILDHDKKNVS
jgi:predicted DNA-binding protein